MLLKNDDIPMTLVRKYMFLNIKIYEHAKPWSHDHEFMKN